MSLLVPFVLTILTTKAVGSALVCRGVSRARPWASWYGAAATGMSAVFFSAATTHFLPGPRSGLIAIVPRWVPEPALMVTLTGVIEVVLALALLHPRTRPWAGLAAAIFLVAVFPANIVAAGGVDHPYAPTTSLIPRLLLQLVFLAAAITPIIARGICPKRGVCRCAKRYSVGREFFPQEPEQPITPRSSRPGSRDPHPGPGGL